MRVKIIFLQRIRNLGSCSYTFSGKPELGKVIPIFNWGGKQIATMEENAKARPTLVCERHRGEEEGCMEGEVLGAKGVQMELSHRAHLAKWDGKAGQGTNGEGVRGGHER